MQHYLYATASDFSRDKILKKIMGSDSDSYAVCEVSECILLVQREGDPLCKDHLAKFIDNLLSFSQDKLTCAECHDGISYEEWKSDKEYPLCTRCGYLTYK